MALYNSSRSKTTTHIGARLSPRRKLYAQDVLDFLWRDLGRWQNRGAVTLNRDTYERIDDHLGLDRFAVNQAVDDLYALGLIDIRMYSVVQRIIPLATNLEEAA